MFSAYNMAFKKILYPTIKTYDLFYKTNQNLSSFKTTNQQNSLVLGIVFKDIKVSSYLASTIFGFGLQAFLSKFISFNFLFGFKHKTKFTSFVLTKQKFFNLLSFFFFANLLYKAIPLGMFKVSPFIPNAYAVKFFVSDLFNFFGVRFFSKFYLDFFDWPSKFVFTYFYPNIKCQKIVPLFFSSFKISII